MIKLFMDSSQILLRLVVAEVGSMLGLAIALTAIKLLTVVGGIGRPSVLLLWGLLLGTTVSRLI